MRRVELIESFLDSLENVGEAELGNSSLGKNPTNSVGVWWPGEDDGQEG